MAEPDPVAAAPSRRSVGLRSERGPLLAGLMLATFLVALNQTIVATAIPAIVADLGDFDAFPWLFSVYLLAQTVATPVLGRLSDVFGRRPIMLGGIAVFGAASLLCALAWSMPALIVFRALQGLGAGAVLPMSNTIAGDVYNLAERAKVQGYIASMWGFASVLGPLVGGVLADYASWRTIFWVSVPLGAAAWLAIRGTFREVAQRTSTSVDHAGAVLLVLGTSGILVGLLEGGRAWPWRSATSLAVLGGGAVLLVAFGVLQRRSSAPTVPPWVFSRRVLVGANAAAVGVGAVTLGLTSYLPTFAQGSLGASAIAAGMALGALTVGWPLASAFAGPIYLRLGFRVTALFGWVGMVVGSGLLVAAAATWESLWALGGACLLVGLGLGLIANPTLIAAQSSVGWAHRGVVTSTNLFFRSMGSCVAVAAFGALANAALAGSTAEGGAPDAAALQEAAVLVFSGVAAVTVLMVAALLVLPGRRHDATPDLASVP